MAAGTRPLPQAIAAIVLMACAFAGVPAGAQTRAPDPDLGDGLRPGADAADPSRSPPAPDESAASDDSSGRDAPPARAGARKASDRLPADPNTPIKTPPERLPALKPYKDAQRLGLRGGPSEPDPDATPAPSVSALPTPPPRRTIKPDPTPFDPVGERIGDLKLTPYIEQDVGYATNPLGSSTDKRPSGFETTEVGLGLQSDWSRSDLHGTLKEGYTDYFKTPQANAPFGSGTIDGRYDISRDLSVDAEGRFSTASETASTLGLGGANIGTLTQVSTWGATAGGAQKFGDFTFALHGTFDRTSYGGDNATSQATDDYDDLGLKLRASYRLSETVSPFVELDGDKRIYDTAVDATGYDRASTGVGVKSGLTLAYSPMLNGEISLGYGARQYRDPRLPDVSAPLIDASLIWAITPLTTMTLKAQTALQDALIAGSSADINRSYTIEVDHDLTRRVKLGLTGSYTTDKYVGLSQTDYSYNLGANVEYHLSREVVLKASATHQQFTSTAANSSYASDIFMLGLRLQR